MTPKVDWSIFELFLYLCSKQAYARLNAPNLKPYSCPTYPYPTPTLLLNMDMNFSIFIFALCTLNHPFGLSLDLLSRTLRLLLLLLLGVVSRERVVHAPISLERAELLDGLGEGVGNVTSLGRGVVTVTDVDLAVGLLVVADDEDEVVCEGRVALEGDIQRKNG